MCKTNNHGHMIGQDSRSRCRPHWDGSIGRLFHISSRKLQSMVGADKSFDQFSKECAPALEAGLAELNTRLAARGVLQIMSYCDNLFASAGVLPVSRSRGLRHGDVFKKLGFAAAWQMKISFAM